MSLDSNRYIIGVIDTSILHLVKSRQQAALRVGRYKKRKNLKIVDKKREADLIAKNKKLAKSIGIPEALAVDISKVLIKHSKLLQQQLFGK